MDELSAILARLERMAAGEDLWLADLFPKQRAFFEEPAKHKAALCGRRAGKTWGCCAGLYEAALRSPRALVPYVTLTGVMARRIFWPVLTRFNEKYHLGMKCDDQEMTATLPENGSKIFCVGGDDRRKVEALRGAPYPRVVIDECGSFPRSLLQYLVEDVLDAALMDLDGDLWTVGSPNAACVGYFHDITTGTNPNVARVPTHHWTVLDNIHLPHAKAWLEKKRADKGWGLDHPVYQREYMGRWVRDANSLVFRFDRARHMVAQSDVPLDMRGVLGIDLGASAKVASMAFVVNMWAKLQKTVFTLRARKFADMNPSDGAEELERTKADYPGISHAVVDAGGLGGGYISEWHRRWGLPVQEAQKLNKFAFVEMLNDALDALHVKILEGAATQPLVDELELLQWNEDRNNFDDRFPDHAIDAWLYGWRDCYAWSEPAPPKKKSLEEQEEARLKRIEQRMRNESRAAGWKRY